MNAEQIGRVVAVLRYPVKSMAAESVPAAEVSWHGLAGDRRWTFVRPGMERSGFPWLTIRERPDLWRYRPRFADTDRPDHSATIVDTPGGRTFDVVDPALAEELGAGVRVLKQNRGVFDVAPISLITMQSVATVAARAGMPLSHDRFRPNLVIDATSTADYPEDAWVGAVLRIGGARLRLDQHDHRCVMVNVNPDSIAREPDVLQTIGRERKGWLGLYGSVVTPGTIAVGDAVFRVNGPS